MDATDWRFEVISLIRFSYRESNPYKKDTKVLMDLKKKIYEVVEEHEEKERTRTSSQSVEES